MLREADLLVRVVGIPANVTGSLTKRTAGGKLMCVAESDLSLMSVCASSSTSSELSNTSECNIIILEETFYRNQKTKNCFCNEFCFFP